MSNEERARAERELAKQTIARIDEMFSSRPVLSDQARDGREADVSGAAQCLEPPAITPAETFNQRHRREITEQERRWAVEREREAKNMAQQQREAEAAIKDKLIQLARATNTLADNVTDKLRHLETKLAQAEARIAQGDTKIAELRVELRQAVVDLGRKSEVIDLPPLSSMRSVN